MRDLVLTEEQRKCLVSYGSFTHIIPRSYEVKIGDLFLVEGGEVGEQVQVSVVAIQEQYGSTNDIYTFHIVTPEDLPTTTE